MTHWAGIVIGSGIAGLSAARGLASQGPVLVVSKSQLHTSATEWAQGGIAVVMHHDDRLSYHFDDTIQAGAGLCDPHAVAILVQDGPQRVAELIALGAQFDRDPDGYSLTQEAAHSQRRILHAGDATGREIEKTLGQALLRQPTVTFLAHTTLLSLIIHHGECVGVILADSQTGAHQQVHFSDVVILATGGCGQLYQRNTNPWVATGDGIMVAYHAGAVLQDIEMIQFHPTTLYGGDVPDVSTFLISEAVRGEGAQLLNHQGERFMCRIHPDAELAPRDQVARAIFSEMNATGHPHVWLDLRPIPLSLPDRFPTIYRRCLSCGIDITRDPIPVSPAAHYVMGGILTDYEGRTSIPRLYAVGECACVGVHGANRLASNSLLDGLVFGHRAAQAAKGHLPIVPPSSAPAVLSPQWDEPDGSIRHALRALMWDRVGIQRDAEGLCLASHQLATWLDHPLPTPLHAMVQLGHLITLSALARTESRGAHDRLDYPNLSPVPYHLQHVTTQPHPIVATIPPGGADSLPPILGAISRTTVPIPDASCDGVGGRLTDQRPPETSGPSTRER